MAVNTLVTGLIVLKILKVFLGNISVGRPSDTTVIEGTGTTKLQHIIFIIIESGMALFAIQLVRVVLSIMRPNTLNLIIGTHQMLNVIIRSVHSES